MIEHAKERDAADPLAPYRERFHVPEGVIYLDGNSLGCLPKATPEAMGRAVEQEWGEGLIAINGHLGSSIAHHLTRFADSGDETHW